MSVSLHNSHSGKDHRSENRLLRVSRGGVGKASQATTDALLGERFFERFSVFVDTDPRPGGCWLWTAAVDAYGYGQIARAGGKSPIKAHRAAWILAHGPISSHQHVLHTCDVPRCVNPAHLFLGDQAANMKDAAAKGRLHTARPNSRTLSTEGERVILDAYRACAGRAPVGLRDHLAAQLGVSPQYVSMIGRGLRKRRPVGATPLSAVGDPRSFYRSRRVPVSVDPSSRA